MVVNTVTKRRILLRDCFMSNIFIEETNLDISLNNHRMFLVQSTDVLCCNFTSSNYRRNSEKKIHDVLLKFCEKFSLNPVTHGLCYSCTFWSTFSRKNNIEKYFQKFFPFPAFELPFKINYTG